MPLQIRRGTEAERQILAAPLVAGELLWITDDKKLYIGDGVTVANLLTPVTGFDANDAISAVAGAFAAGTQSGISFSYNGVNAISATVSYPSLLQNLNVNNFNIVDTGATVLINGATGAINLDGTVKGNVIPNANEAYDLGSASNRFRDLYLSGSSLFLGTAQITASGSAVNLPAGSTVDGISIASIASGVVEGSNYKINIVGEDSSILVNAQTGVISSTSGFIGDLIGSVFGQDSSLIIDAISNEVFANVSNNSVNTGNLLVSGTTNSVRIEPAGIDLIIDDASNPEISPGIRIISDSGPDDGGDLFRILTYHDNATSNDIIFLRAKGSSSIPTALSSGDSIYKIRFIGQATDDVSESATIEVISDPLGTVSGTTVPGKILFKTNNDSGTLATKLSIDKDGIVDFFDNTTTAGSDPGEVDLATSTVAESWLRVKVGGVEYALPLYAINP